MFDDFSLEIQADELFSNYEEWFEVINGSVDF